MSGTLVPPTAPRPPDREPNPDRVECEHGYAFKNKCPVCTPRPGMSAKEAERLAADRKRHK